MHSFLGAPKMLSVLVVMAFLLVVPSTANFSQDVTVYWAGRAQIYDGGQGLNLSIDRTSGSGVVSNNEYLYARVNIQLKLMPGNSAGTVTTFYLSSNGSAHDEIDFEFLGNSSGQPYTIHTNVFAQGVGEREQQFRPWFDPTSEFHNYTILWNSQRIVFMIDNIPIRVFNNYAANGVPFPTSQPMKIYCSIWNGDEWATQGGRVKIDWSNAPFTAAYRNLNADGCAVSQSGGNSCGGATNGQAWQTQVLDDNQMSQMQSIQRDYMIHNYCTDFNRFPQGGPRECTLTL